VSDTMPTEKYGDVGAVDGVAVRGEDGSVTVFAVNRDQHNAHRLTADLSAFPGLTRATVTIMSGEDLTLTNSLDAPDRVAPRELPATPLGEGLSLELPAVSWAMVRITA